ncbi:MAG TPA: hypothetical protein DD713_01775 [Nitrospiraceae bacterium]|nr:hypothetical protein [Nitrospiraceae bacterium]
MDEEFYKGEAVTYSRSRAFALGLAAGAVFTAIWSIMAAVLEPWGDLSKVIVAVLSSAVAGGMTSYKLGSSGERVGALSIFPLFGAIFLDAFLAKGIDSLGNVIEIISERHVVFYAINIIFGALIGAIFGKREKRG